MRCRLRLRRHFLAGGAGRKFTRDRPPLAAGIRVREADHLDAAAFHSALLDDDTNLDDASYFWW